MTNQVWNDTNRSKIFHAVRNQWGPHDRYTFTGGAYAPKGTSKEEIERVYQQIYLDIYEYNRRNNLKYPKDWKAVANQVNWTTCTGYGAEWTGIVQRELRLIAYRSNFLSMDDILFLEREAERKAAISSKEAMTISMVENEDADEDADENILSTEPKTKGDKIMVAIRHLDNDDVKYWKQFSNVSDAIDTIWQCARDRYGWNLKKSYIGYVIQGVIQYAKFNPSLEKLLDKHELQDANEDTNLDQEFWISLKSDIDARVMELEPSLAKVRNRKEDSDYPWLSHIIPGVGWLVPSFRKKGIPRVLVALESYRREDGSKQQRFAELIELTKPVLEAAIGQEMTEGKNSRYVSFEYSDENREAAVEWAAQSIVKIWRILTAVSSK